MRHSILESYEFWGTKISTEEEHRIIKGYYTQDLAEEIADQSALAPVKSYEIKDLYGDLVREHQVIFKYWLKPDYSAKALEDAGYKPFQLHRALDNWTINSWIHSSIMNGQQSLTGWPMPLSMKGAQHIP